jgi:hypothetical protein
MRTSKRKNANPSAAAGVAATASRLATVSCTSSTRSSLTMPCTPRGATSVSATSFEYYRPRPEALVAVDGLFAKLADKPVPEPLISQHFLALYPEVVEGSLSARPRELVLGGDLCRRTFRPIATSTAAIRNVRLTEGFRTAALCRRAGIGRGAGVRKPRKEETAGRKRRVLAGRDLWGFWGRGRIAHVAAEVESSRCYGTVKLMGATAGRSGLWRQPASCGERRGRDLGPV